MPAGYKRLKERERNERRHETREKLNGGRHTSVLFKIRLYILVAVSAEVRRRETREEEWFIKQREKVSKTDSYIDKSKMLKVFTF